MDVKEERTLFQKSVLIILAAMIVVFGVVNGFNQTREGILFRDKFLRREEVTDADCFTGKVEGESVTILRWYGDGSETREITLQVGERIHDTYTVYLGEPMIPLKGVTASQLLEVPTVRVTRNDAVIFEGGYQASSGFFFTPEGEWSVLGIHAMTDGTAVDWVKDGVPHGFLVGLALGPELVTRGDWRLYALMVFLTLAMMVDVAFPYTLFCWRYRHIVKDPEPTDDYMAMQHLGWAALPVILLIGYIWAATVTF